MQGVYDPAAVSTWALSNAASISGALLTTECVISSTVGEEEEEYVPEVSDGIGREAADYAW